MEKKKVIYILVVFIIGLIFLSGTLAYYRWESDTASDTEVTLSIEKEYSCSADGGGDITNTDAVIAPSNCMDSTHAIQRELTVTPTLIRDDISINTTLYLQVDLLDSGLSNSENFRYAITTSNTSCETGVISAGNFKGLTIGDQVRILNENYSTSIPQKYYLYIWLDKEETSSSTMNQKFKFSITGSCTDEVKPEEPVLDDGMIPVTIANNGTVKTILPGDEDWYDYENKKWANVVLVNDASRASYKGTTGKTVTQSDILAYYVWIPRYSYKIPATCSAISNVNVTDYPECYRMVISDDDKEKLSAFWYNFVRKEIGVSYTTEQAMIDVEDGLETLEIKLDGRVQGNLSTFIDNVYNAENNPDIEYEIEIKNTMLASDAPRAIDILFEPADLVMTAGDAVNEYRTHPSFWWDDDNDSVVDSGETLSGIWVGKFESSGSTNITILPNVAAKVGGSPSTYELYAKEMSKSGNLYGLSNLTSDAHGLKNVDWAAVAYLSHSKYGQLDKIRGNNNNGFRTGCGASSVTANATSSCQIPYGGASIYPQSTTGNITGIFDMAGGAWEYTFSFFDINHEFGISKYSNKYYTSSSLTACLSGKCYGHALYETAGWYGERNDFVNPTYPYMIRGGYYQTNNMYGLFSFSRMLEDLSDGVLTVLSWRSAIVVRLPNN